MTSKRLILIGTVVTVLLCLGESLSGSDNSTQEPRSAPQILSQIRRTYANCKSYQDSGTITAVLLEANEELTVASRFSTAFIRPDRFRFDYVEKLDNNQFDRYVIWCKGRDVRVAWDLRPDVEKPTSLGSALSAALGVSNRSAHTIPALLLPDDVKGRKVTDMVNAKLINDDNIDKVRCMRIQGESGSDKLILWIDAKTFLIRRLDVEHAVGKGLRRKLTTTYSPEMDKQINEKELEFISTLRK